MPKSSMTMAILGFVTLGRSGVTEANFCFDGLSRAGFTGGACVSRSAIVFGLDFRLELTGSEFASGRFKGVLYA